MASLKQATLDMATAIQKELKYDKESHTITGEDTYVKHIPEGLSEEVIEKVDNYNTTFIAATAHAVGNLAIEHMAKSKTLDSVSAQFDMGKHNHVTHEITREKTFPNPADNGSPIVKHGSVSSVYKVYAGRNAGELKKVRAEIEALAEEKLVK